MENHTEVITARIAGGKRVCLGIDPDIELMKTGRKKGESESDFIGRFSIEIVDATKDLVAAYKPNPAFFMRYGSEGLASLERLIDETRRLAPGVPIILDQMPGDTENTNRMWAKMAFDHLKVDAVTAQYYMGSKTLVPFTEYASKGVYVLVKSSNRGSDDLQGLELTSGLRVYQEVAKQIKGLSKLHDNFGLVVAGTFPYDMRSIRDITKDMKLPYIVPGLITQGGKVNEVIQAGQDSRGGGLLFAVSRSILYAHGGGKTQAENSRAELEKLIQEIRDGFKKEE